MSKESAGTKKISHTGGWDVAPVGGDGGLYLFNPTLEDEEVVVACDGHAVGLAAVTEVLFDELVQGFLVLFEIEGGDVVVQCAFEHCLELLELLGLVVARGNVPVEIVLVENAYYMMKLDEGNLLGIESTEEHRRHVLFVGVCLADGYNELNEGVDDAVRRPFLGLGPKKPFSLKEFGLVWRSPGKPFII